MIQPFELMIGNYVLFDLNDGILVKITDIGQSELFGMYETVVEMSAHISEFNPIPLSEEWLISLGFKKWEDRYTIEAWGPGHPSQRFDIDWKDGNIIMVSRYQESSDDLLMRHIEHVHQIQNLYFCLTGKKLKRNG